MTADRDRKLDKIRKCLRLARSSNEHEAAAALRQAQKMMSELGVSADDVVAPEVAEARVRANSLACPPTWEVFLATTVSDAIGVDSFFSMGAAGSGKLLRGQWSFVGCGGNEQIARYAFTALRRRLSVARSEYMRTMLKRHKRSNKTAFADLYCRGWVAAIRRKVQTLVVAEAEKNAIALYLRRYQLVETEKEEAAVKPAQAGHVLRGFRAAADIDLRRPMTGKPNGLEALS